MRQAPLLAADTVGDNKVYSMGGRCHFLLVVVVVHVLQAVVVSWYAIERMLALSRVRSRDGERRRGLGLSATLFGSETDRSTIGSLEQINRRRLFSFATTHQVQKT